MDTAQNKEKKNNQEFYQTVCVRVTKIERAEERKSNGFLLEIEQNTQEFYQTFRVLVTIPPKL